MLRRTEVHSIAFRNARVIDPFSDRDDRSDVLVSDGRIGDKAPAHATEIDASNWIICPGLMDMHVHLREPGQTHKETIQTGSAAAASGGFTAVACMPNTTPPLDNVDIVRWVRGRGQEVGLCAVHPVAAITVGRAGAEVTDFAALKEAGAVAFSDDGDGVEDDAVMLQAFERAAKVDAVLIQHCEYKSLSAGGVMHLGKVSARLGLPGLDPRSEEAMIERDIDLCRKTGGRYHVAHISTKKAVELVRAAKAEGLPVTTEACTHHLMLTDEACCTGDPNTKMHPPLRPQADVLACRTGLAAGTIDCVVTDHAPHSAEEKARGFMDAPPGIVGLETAIGVASRALIESQVLAWYKLIESMTLGPALVLRLPKRPILADQPVELTIIDPKQAWDVNPSAFASMSRNTPFGGFQLPARAAATIRGRYIFDCGAISNDTRA